MKVHDKNFRLTGMMLFMMCLVLVKKTGAQTSSFLPGFTDDFLRRTQLLGKSSLQNSFATRSFLQSLEGIDSLDPVSNLVIIKNTGKLKCKLLPVSITGQSNSDYPMGRNDGSMIPSRGNSTMLSAGFRADIGKFSVTINPEIVFQENKPFETFFKENYDTTWSKYYSWLNKIDLPENFGTSSRNKIFPGQSSIRYNSYGMSIGLSTENMWWGPGRSNALVMSNNAPGFLHFTFNSLKPLKTGAGTFEWQLVAGKLQNSGIIPPETNRYYTNGVGPIYQAKNGEGRYISGLLVSWQPKWVPGLFVGFAKASYLYKSDVGLLDLLPLEGIIKTSSEKNGRKASLGSLFARYVMPEEKAEFYLEYGRNDKSPNLFNLVADSRYPRAYVAGFRKLFSLKKDNLIELSSEFTQMQLPQPGLIQNAQSWYLHDYVRMGYTNQGQVIGAGIGPGGNSQMINVSWVKELKRIGLMFERIVHNNDFYYNAFSDSKDFRRHWIDLSGTLSGEWNYKRLLLSAQFTATSTLNYEWWYFDYLPLTTGTNYFKEGYDVRNFHARISVSYRL